MRIHTDKNRAWPKFLSSLICALVTTIQGVPATSHAELPSKVAGDEIVRAMQPFVDQQTMAGAVLLVATKDKVLALNAIGYADLAAKKPMQTDSVFWIASMTKPFTATSLMMLVDEGKLSLNDPVDKYLPEFKDLKVIAGGDAANPVLKQSQRPMLVRDLLCHTSGLQVRESNETREKPLRERVREYPTFPLKFEPEADYQYSNSGMNTAGAIVEVVSGMRYEAFLDQRILKPLGMNETTFWPSEEEVKRLAKTYKIRKGSNTLEESSLGAVMSLPLSSHKRSPGPAGGLFSTATDLTKFCQMFLNGGVYEGKRYLSQEAFKQMTTNETQMNKHSYGFGWAMIDKGFGHGGAYKTSMDIYPDLGLISIFLVQQASEWPNGAKNVLPTFQDAAKKLAPAAR